MQQEDSKQAIVKSMSKFPKAGLQSIGKHQAQINIELKYLIQFPVQIIFGKNRINTKIQYYCGKKRPFPDELLLVFFSNAKGIRLQYFFYPIFYLILSIRSNI